MSEDIYQLAGSENLLLNKRFYEENMGENTYSKELIVTTPVDIKSVRVDWILHTQSGLEFLVKMSRMDSSIF